MPLNVNQRTALAVLEKEWSVKGQIPPVDWIKDQFGLEDHEVKSDEFITALKNRGIKSPLQRPDLTDRQISAVLTMCNYMDDRPWRTKLKSLGLTPTQWAGWMKQTKFRQFVEQISTMDFDSNVQVAHQGLMKAMDRGSTDAIKFYLEATGRHTSSSEVNVKAVVGRLVEAIQRHVHDPETLRAISADFDLALKGEQAPMRAQAVVDSYNAEPSVDPQNGAKQLEEGDCTVGIDI